MGLSVGRLYSLDWSGLDWNGLEWTGLTQKSVKCLFQCRTEAKHTYSVTEVSSTACFRVFARVVRGQRSRAYLMSFSNELQSVVDDRGIFVSVFYASAKGWSSISAVNKCSSNLFIEAY